MINVGTFFAVIAMALASSISIENQAQSMMTEGLKTSNFTSPSNPPETDKGIFDWFTNFISSIGGGSATTPSPALGPAVFPSTCKQCKCGLTNKRNRIVGGMETLENQYPWMILLLHRGTFYCGGTIISSRHVLTAAHCIDGFDQNSVTVRVLEHDRNYASGGKTQDFKVQKMMKHSGYSTTNYNNDIALITLSSEIQFNEMLRPVCLPEFTKTFAGEKAIVTGWGATGESGPISNTLQEVTVPILSNTDCRNTKYPSRRITDNMLCAGYTEGGKDSCQGDSGGPLHVVKDSIHSIVGVVSWGEGCAAPNYPGVYTRVNRFITWIQRNTREGCYC